MEGEVNNFIMVCALVYVSVCYCYAVAKIIPKGTTRLVTFLPVVCLFLALPLNYLHSISLGGITCLFISWLANFKLLMFALDVGPLADPSLSLAHFVALACLPIKFQHSPPPQPLKKPLREAQNKENLEKPKSDPKTRSPYCKTSKTGLESPLNYGIKVLVLALCVRGYNYTNYLHPKLVRFQIIVHLFLHTEILLAISATLAQFLLRTKVEPQFGDPYLSTSVQNFWGKRWNLMVSDTLRLSIYGPIRSHLRPILGHEWSLVPALLGSYLVSGLMHELIFYQMGRMRPKWGSTMYFLVQGLCLVVEIAMKKKFKGTFKLPPLISGVLSIVFVAFTFSRLVVTELLQFRIIDRMIGEYVVVGTFMKDIIICLCSTNKLFRHAFI